MRFPLLQVVLKSSLVVVLFTLSLVKVFSQGNCECSNCPQFMPDNFTGSFLINVQNAANPTLGQNGQGVCGVQLNFDHEYIGDLSITLTSPSGQTVTLVGPIGFFGATDGSTWDITFLQCGDPGVSPDPGFSNQWSNNQPWGLNGTYTGAYYPSAGCLQNFTGPVNGTWSLTVTDGQANDVGNFYDYEIIFCDPTGIDCFSCAADAGNLLQPDVSACEGSPNLNLNLPPTYTPQMPQPPANEYSYTYVIGGAGGVLLGYEPGPDLSAYPPGTYTVCGLSYYTLQANLLPVPDGSLTIMQLRNQLNGTTASFCGDVSVNCVNVIINQAPPDIEETVEICAPECYFFGGANRCQTGTYTTTLTQNGCQYTSTLYLTVGQPKVTSLVEVVCAGQCSSNPTFPDACEPGMYSETLTTAFGCDSIVNLNLLVLGVEAVIVDPPALPCGGGLLSLQGTGSTTGGGVTYSWSSVTGGPILGPTSQINASVNTPGTYQLRVCRIGNGVICCDSTTVDVMASTDAPDAPSAILGPDTLCQGQTVSYTIQPVAGATSYTWSFPSGVTLNSGGVGLVANITWDTIAGGLICVTANNACGPSEPTCLNVQINSAASGVVPQGPASVCVGDTVVYFVNTSASASPTNLNWIIPSQALLLAGQGTDSIQVVWIAPGPDTLCVTNTNSCGVSAPQCLTVQVGIVLTMPTIVGDSLLCAGDTGVYTIQPVNGATGYNWQVPMGGTIVSTPDSTTITVHWTAAPGGMVQVVPLGACGTVPNAVFLVVVLEVPVANAGLDQVVCGTAANVAASGTPGSWSMISGPGTILFSDSTSASTLATASSPGSYVLRWTANNGGCMDLDEVEIIFNPIPQIGSYTALCDNANEFYTVSFPILGGTAPLTVAGGSITNGQFTSDPILSGQAFSFMVTDSNGCVSETLQGSVNCNCTTNAGSMSNSLLKACKGMTVIATSISAPVLDGNDIGIFVLHEGLGVTIVNPIASNTTGEFGYQPGMIFGQTYYVSYVVGNNVNGMPDPADPCLSVAPGQPVQFFNYPNANAGLDLSTCTTSLSLQATGVGTWSVVSGPGVLQLSSSSSPTSIVQAGVPGVYTLSWLVVENMCSSSDTVELTFNTPPSTTNLLRDCDPTGQFYTVSFEVTGGSGPYSVNGVALTGSLFVSASVPTGDSYSYEVIDANGCKAPLVTGIFACNCTTMSGILSSQLIQVCGAESAEAEVTIPAILDPNDVVAYVLHTGSGSVLGTVLAQNSTGVFTYQPSMVYGQVYYISQVVGNNLLGLPNPLDPCFKVSIGQPVQFWAQPVADAGSNSALCGNQTVLMASPSSFSGQWSVGVGPGFASIASSNSNISAVSVASSGVYTFYWETVNAVCTAIDSVQIQFNPVPTAQVLSEQCNNTATQYSVELLISGGTSPYTVTGVPGALNGNVFTSAGIASSVGYSLTVTDGNGCTFGPIAGIKSCDCITYSGTMDLTPLTFCADVPAVVPYNNDGQLDGNDLLRFVLHTGMGTSLGQVIAVSSIPEFTFSAGMQYGQVYYLSALVGNGLNGQVDITDPCLSVSKGTPVQWKPLPTASVAGSTAICLGDAAQLTFSGAGVYPLTLSWQSQSGVVQTTVVTGPGVQTIPVMPTETTTFTLIGVSDGSLPTCQVDLNEAVTIVVNYITADAGIALPDTEVCFGQDTLINLFTLLEGETPGGLWTEQSSMPSTGTAFNAGLGTFYTGQQGIGVYRFRYSVSSAAPCPGDAVEVAVLIRPAPTADAGVNQELSCVETAVLLGGIGTSTGDQYNWNMNGMALPGASEPTLQVEEPGVYQLIVRNAFGCTAIDEVEVIQNAERPIVESVISRDIRCYGLGDGGIVIEAITGGLPPYLSSLNGGAFIATQQYSNLKAGAYELVVIDSKGCISDLVVVNVQEPLPLEVNLGPDVFLSLGDSLSVAATVSPEDAVLNLIEWDPLFDPTGAGTLLQGWSPTRPSSIDILIRDTMGCTAQDRLLIFVDTRRHVYVPNIFDPLSSESGIVTVYGGNDVALVESFQIFDRWGDLVFEQKDFLPSDESKGWDGQFGSKLAEPAVYVWKAVVLFKDGFKELISGDVTLLR